MSKYYHDDIEIDKLRLDSSNPRHGRLDSQREIIDWMTSGIGKIGDKLLTLAKDIVEYGLNPSDRITVVPDSENDQEYIVLEGNRRVTAIKLLNNPDRAPGKEWQSRFRKIHSSSYSIIKKVPCTIYYEASDAFHFIELKHQGESGGAGVVPWDAEQKARHYQRLHSKSRHHKALALLDFVRNSEHIDEDVKRQAVEGFPITTIDRILSDKEFRAFLGLGLNDSGELTFQIDPREAQKPISKVIKDFGSGKKKVGDVINKKQREQYIQSFRKDVIADHSKTLSVPVAVESAQSRTDLTTIGSGHLGKRYGDPRNRKFIVISGTSLAIDPKKYNRAKRVFEELRRVHLRDKDGKPQFPNAGILLLRLFIEMSVDIYIAEHKLTHVNPKGWKDVSLTERTKAVLKNLETLGALTDLEIKVVSKTLGDKNKLGNPNSLNDFAHNLHQIPNPSDLIDVWDTYTKFLIALWDNIR